MSDLLLHPRTGKVLRVEPDGYAYGTLERAEAYVFRVFPDIRAPSGYRVDYTLLSPQDFQRLEEGRFMRISQKEFLKLCPK